MHATATTCDRPVALYGLCVPTRLCFCCTLVLVNLTLTRTRNPNVFRHATSGAANWLGRATRRAEPLAQSSGSSAFVNRTGPASERLLNLPYVIEFTCDFELTRIFHP